MSEDDKVLKDYIKTLKKKLFWMSSKKKKVLIDETEAHLTDIAEDEEELNDQAYRKAIERFGTPTEIARNYKKQYGYGKKFTGFLIILVILTAALTIPAISNLPPLGDDEKDREKAQTIAVVCGVISVIFTILTFAIIIFAGVKGGKRTGTIIGSVAFFTRTLFMIILALVYSKLSSVLSNKMGETADISIGFSSGQFCGLMFISLLMIPAGFLAGRAIKKFKKEELFEDEDWD